MTAIELAFPSGRFHATPWGRHVNEGAVEWPPSPWRLLRALVATWKRKTPELADEPAMRDLLTSLSAPPQFVLPPATFSHTRHYMPWYKKGPGDKTLVFDSFVALAKDAPLNVVWPDLVLTPHQHTILEKLLPLLGTLGRAESWCQGRLLDTDSEGGIAEAINCRPLNGQPPAGEVVRILGVNPDEAFQNNHNPNHKATSGRGKHKTTSVTPLYEPDWHLCMETLWLHEQRWSMPPGARWIDYERTRDALAQPRPRTIRRQPSHTMQVARFALDSSVLPLLTDTLRIAESARIALMSKYGWLTKVGDVKGKSRIFAGKEADGTPVQDHRHCFYLPTDENDDGRLDHLTLYAADGFGPDELRAIDKLREIKTKNTEESGHPLSVILTGFGTFKEFQPGPLAPACSWLSATPFVSPRHPKTRGRLKQTEAGGADISLFLMSQVRRELENWLNRNEHTLPIEEIGIELLHDNDGVTRRWCPHKNTFNERAIQFRRFRKKRGDDGGRRPSAFFRITFPEPIPGPLALGHSCHFGLGVFVPVQPNPSDHP